MNFHKGDSSTSSHNVQTSFFRFFRRDAAIWVNTINKIQKRNNKLYINVIKFAGNLWRLNVSQNLYIGDYLSLVSLTKIKRRANTKPCRCIIVYSVLLNPVFQMTMLFGQMQRFTDIKFITWFMGINTLHIWNTINWNRTPKNI
jgi:hypothetical protein